MQFLLRLSKESRRASLNERINGFSPDSECVKAILYRLISNGNSGGKMRVLRSITSYNHARRAEYTTASYGHLVP